MAIQAQNVSSIQFSIHDGTDWVPVDGVSTLTPPSLIMEAPIDVTHHGSPGGIREWLNTGIMDWSECTGSWFVDYADAGQNLVRASLGQSKKFKVYHASWPADKAVIFMANVVSVVMNAAENPSAHVEELTLKPTGARLTS